MSFFWRGESCRSPGRGESSRSLREVDRSLGEVVGRDGLLSGRGGPFCGRGGEAGCPLGEVVVLW